MAIDKITQVEIDANNVKSASDTPTGTSTDIKNIFDKLPELISTKFNSLVDKLASFVDGSSGADQIGATPLKVSGATTVQTQLEELKADKVETADIISAVTTEMRENKVPNEKAVYDIMEAIGAGDMVKSVYDPTNQAKDVFAEITALNTSLNVLNMDRGYKDSKVINGVNIDTLKANGKYIGGNLLGTLPSNIYASAVKHLEVTGIETDYLSQQLFSINSSGVTAKWVRLFDKGSNTWIGWKELATTETTELTLLNGWAGTYNTKAYATKVGHVVDLALRITGGTTSYGTIIATLPSNFIPSLTSQDTSMLALNYNTRDIAGIVFVDNAGNLKINVSLNANADMLIAASYLI